MAGDLRIQDELKRVTLNAVISSIRLLGRHYGFVTGEKLFVEKHFLNSKLSQDFPAATATAPTTGVIDFDDCSYDCLAFVVHVFHKDTEELNQDFTFCYFEGENGYLGPNHGLIIIDQDRNKLYWREPGEDEKTSWRLNELARDITDADGHYIFDGDPCNI